LDNDWFSFYKSFVWVSVIYQNIILKLGGKFVVKTNKEKVVKISVQGKIHSPIAPTPFRIDNGGRAHVIPGTGGITYNVKVGDSVYGWVGDHIEPGVSIKSDNLDENKALIMLSCIGNEVKVVSGEAKGAMGYVTGKHGGIDHVLVYFDEETLDKLAINDILLVKAYGQGMEIEGSDDVKVMNIDPNLIEKIGIEISDDNILSVPVVAECPPYLMGSGTGMEAAQMGDYDIMTADREELKKHNLDKLRFGDLVLLKDCDNTHGVGYLGGAVSVGVVVHSDCIKGGHGPGICVIMTSKKTMIKGRIDSSANIVNFMGL
jgi:hypothetical protein